MHRFPNDLMNIKQKFIYFEIVTLADYRNISSLSFEILTSKTLFGKEKHSIYWIKFKFFHLPMKSIYDFSIYENIITISNVLYIAC